MNYKERISNTLLNQHASGMSYQEIADFYGVSKAMAWRVANQGYEPVNDDIRDKLGFPEIIKQLVFRNPSDGRFQKETDDETSD